MLITLILLTILVFIGFHFTTMSHPLAMGLMLLVQSLVVSLFTGGLSPTFWFSYILFLVFLGGLMVLFIYVTSLASNEMFSLSSLSILTLVTLSTVLLLIMAAYDAWFTNVLLNYSSLEKLTCLNEYLIKLYSFPTSLLTSFLVIYLLLTLIVVVNITKYLNGPLRVSN